MGLQRGQKSAMSVLDILKRIAAAIIHCSKQCTAGGIVVRIAVGLGEVVPEVLSVYTEILVHGTQAVLQDNHIQFTI